MNTPGPRQVPSQLLKGEWLLYLSIQKVSNILSLSLGFIYFSNQIFMPNTLNLDSKLMELVEYSKSIANIVWVSSQNCREYFGQLQIFPPICQIFHDDCVGKQYEVEYNLHKI